MEPKDAAIRDYPDSVIHPAFKVVDGLRCSALSLPNAEGDGVATLEDRLQARMRVQLSKMAIAELVSGEVSGGPSLVLGTALPASASIARAAINVESWLASVLHNGLGVVVIPIGLIPAAVEAGWVNLSTMTTATGHSVIADAGFTGDPSNPTDGTPSAFTVFGLAMPAYASANPVFLEVASGTSHVNITNNDVSQIVETYMQVAFDPCTVGKTLVS
ncbi:hypothetical protein [Gemmatimonas sp.]|uniref:hypothetical protein n=1 Tax=Gemmatimonas sp. TaxID=1962908 RepID=UPI0035676C1A